METSIYQFEEPESLIRDRWLKITMINAAVSLIISITLAFLKEDSPVSPVNFLAYATPLAYTYWLYHCTYKRHGTKLLTFTFALSAISLPLQIYGLTLKPETSIYIAFGLDLPFNIWWMVISYQLRKIYKQKKRELAPVNAK